MCLKWNIHNVRKFEDGYREDIKGGRIVEHSGIMGEGEEWDRKGKVRWGMGRTIDIAQLVECLSGMQEDLGLFPNAS